MASFNFELVSPEALVLSGDAKEVVVPGTEGYFTVMANHSAMMSTVKQGCIDVTLEDGSVKHFFVRGGFADVSPTGMTLLAEEATEMNDIDMNALESELADAKAAVSAADTPEAVKKAADKLHEFEDGLTAVRARMSSM